jgi:hypothetical protein
MVALLRNWLSRRGGWSFSVLALLACLALSVLVSPGDKTPRIRFTRRQANLIVPGEVREEQVTALLGVPPGDYTTRTHGALPSGNWPPFYLRDWISDDGCIRVVFWGNYGVPPVPPKLRGTVFQKGFQELPPGPTILERGLAWLRWLGAKIGL